MPRSDASKIQSFLAEGPWAVAGASANRSKYGNKVLRCYQQHGMKVYPLNPHETTVEGLPAFKTLGDLPEPVLGLSLITPPRISEGVVKEAIQAGVKRLWFQPGAESQSAIEEAEAAGLEVIAWGPCLLVVVGYRERE
jgi:predicted CoA-binding protein